MSIITICIATYKRPNMLGNLLESLSVQTVLENRNVQVKVAIVDNDPSASAWTIVTQWTDRNSLPIVYEVEKQRGISFVRNRLVRLAKGSDFIAFIDDDEIAHKNWLEELLHVQDTYNADVLAGPVLPKYQEQPPDWMIKGKFFDRPQYKTGDPVKTAGTGNVLVRNALLKQVNGPFEEKLELQGGEDTLLFTKLSRFFGAHMVWANHAIVKEYIPSSRIKASWLIKRHYRSGLTMGTIESHLAEPLSGWRLVRLAKGIANVIRGVLLLMPAVFSGRGAQIRAICILAVGAGSIASLMKLKYNEYQIIHGH